MSRMEDVYPAGGWLHTSVPGASRVTPLAVSAGEVRFLYSEGGPPASRVYAPNAMSVPLVAPPGEKVKNTVFLTADNAVERFSSRRRAVVGDTLQVQACAGDSGIGRTEPISIEYFFSTDTVLDSADISAGAGEPFSIGAFSASCRDEAITVPALPDDEYRILYALDGTSSGETINIISSELRVDSLDADSAIEAIYARVRGRLPNGFERGLGQAALDGGQTLAEFERQLRSPVISETTGSFTIDGEATEEAWDTQWAQPIGHLLGTGALFLADDASGEWRASYDQDNLYLYISVTDDVRGPQDHFDANNWHLDDSVELYIDADGSGGVGYGPGDFQLGFRPDNDSTVYEGMLSATPAAPIDFAVLDHTPARGYPTDDNGYDVEVAIPWVAIGVAPSSRIGFEVHINDDDGSDRDKQVTWVTDSESAYLSTDHFTPVSFVAQIPALNASNIVVNGFASESDWSQLPRPVSRQPAPQALANGVANWRALWDHENLYLFVGVLDSDPVTPLNDSAPYNDDGVEVYVDVDHDHDTGYDLNDRQFLIRRNDGQVFAGANTPSETEGITAAVQETLIGYQLEVAIPWYRLGALVYDGATLGLDVHVNDNDDSDSTRDGKRSWHALIDDSWFNPTTFGAVQLVGSAATQDVSVPHTDTAPDINGDIAGDTGWSAWSDEPLTLERALRPGPSLSVSTKWRSVWTDEALYFAVEVTDNGYPQADEAAWWNDDAVELFIDADHSRGDFFDGTNDFQFLFRPGDEDAVTFGDVSVRQDIGIEVESNASASGYTMEIKIPWATLNVFGLSGAAFGFDIHVDDDDPPDTVREGKIAWAGHEQLGDITFRTPTLLRRLVLAD